MRIQKAVILFFLLASLAISQTRQITFTFLTIAPNACDGGEIFINGKSEGFTNVRGRYQFDYDTTRAEKYTVEVVDTLEKVSKRISITLGKNQINPESKLVYLNLLGAYLNIDESKDDLDETLNYFKEAGVTDVYVPIFVNGKALYPSKVEGVESSDRDYLKEILAKCEKLHFRVYAAINTLNWGVETSAKLKLKDYLMVNKKGEYNKGEEGKYQFVSPAHPEVIRILTEITKEIAINYRNLTGINFDYLRFKKGSSTNLAQEDFGFEKNSIDLFKSTTKLDPYKIKLDTTSGSPWFQWIEFKENLITNLLVKLVSAAKDTNSNLRIVINLNPSYLSNRVYDLTCANAIDIEQFIYPDHYFLEVSKKDLKNEMRMLDQYLPSNSPFEEKEVMMRRRFAFIPLIKDNSLLSPDELNKMIDILVKKEKGADFSIYDQTILKNKINREQLIKIATN